MNAAAKSSLVFQFKVSLKGITPAIWRRIQVPHDYTFWDLHVAVQDAMGWLDYQLHVFRIGHPETGEIEEIGIPGDEPFEDDLPCLPGWKVPLSAYFFEPGDTADYQYDFGDNWEHKLLLEDILERAPRQQYPKCLAGKGACPPEDCGGIWGYEELLRIIRDPSHEECERMMEWLGGGHDPEAFDPKQVRFDDPHKRWKIAFGND